MVRNYARLFVISFIACFIFTLSSCNYNDVLGDPDKNDTIPFSCTITGFVLDEYSKHVDAWVKLSNHDTGEVIDATSTSRANGSAYSKYAISVDVLGTYDIICGAAGFINDTTTVVVDGTSNIIFNNIMLKTDDSYNEPEDPDTPAEDKDDINEKDMASNGNGTMYGYIVTKSIEKNDLAKIRIELLTDSADAQNIRLSALYSGRDVRLAESGMVMMIGARVTSTSGTESNKNFKLTFNLDDKMSKFAVVRYYDIEKGEWVDAECISNDGKLIVNTNKFGSYGVFINCEIRDVEETKDTVFSVHRFNSGLYPLTLENVMYTYKMGAEIFPSYGLDVLQALMIEYMAAKNGYYSENVNTYFDFHGMQLLYDHGYKAWGVQKKILTIISSNGCIVECYKYGDITLYTYSYRFADHKGGGND